MTPDADVLSDDIDTLRAALAAERAARLSAEARATGAEAMIAHLKLLSAKLQRDRFGPTSERSRRLLDQLELQLEEREANAAEADAEPAAPGDPGEHPRRHLAHYTGILQADAYAGFNELYRPGRRPGAISEAACWAHGRRKFFVLADVAKAPIAIEAVRRIDLVFDVERTINGLIPEQRRAARQEQVVPLVAELEAWMRTERTRLSRHNEVSRAMDYMLKRWPAFTRFFDDGRICLTNNAAERALRGIALGRKSWLFAGSDRGGERAADVYTLIITAKLNGVDPRAWLADILRGIADQPEHKLGELLPWNWSKPKTLAAAAA